MNRATAAAAAVPPMQFLEVDPNVALPLIPISAVINAAACAPAPTFTLQEFLYA